MTVKKTDTEIAVVILAAGSSSRLGKPKQLLMKDSEYLINRIIAISDESYCDKLYLVIGANAEKVLSVIKNKEITIVKNEQWQTGIGSSIKAGLISAMEDKMDAVLYLVVDQINLTSLLLIKLINSYKETEKNICASAYNGTFGIPAIFDRNYFSEILKIDNSNGCKSIIEEHLSDTVLIAFPGGEADIDTEKDLLLL